MNIEQTAAVLAKAAALDNRNTSEAAILAWHEAIGDLDFRDALAAVTVHRRESDQYLMPVHIRRIAEKLRAERREREFAEERRRELAAYAADAGPLTDRSAEIRAFVAQVRGTLPDGDPEALAPRREFWRREHASFARQATGTPNPDYALGQDPDGVWERSRTSQRRAWWLDDARREADAAARLAEQGRLRRRSDDDTPAS